MHFIGQVCLILIQIHKILLQNWTNSWLAHPNTYTMPRNKPLCSPETHNLQGAYTLPTHLGFPTQMHTTLLPNCPSSAWCPHLHTQRHTKMYALWRATQKSTWPQISYQFYNSMSQMTRLWHPGSHIITLNHDISKTQLISSTMSRTKQANSNNQKFYERRSHGTNSKRSYEDTREVESEHQEKDSTKVNTKTSYPMKSKIHHKISIHIHRKYTILLPTKTKTILHKKFHNP